MRRYGSTEERGVVIVIVALIMVALLIVVALVLDLGNVRNTRQSNKSTADFAVTAGLQGMAHVDGTPRPWAGVCSALRYLEANQPDLELEPTFFDGDGTELADVDPCSDSGRLNQVCAASTDTWAWIRGVDGSLTVDIRSGYVTPDAAFDEDAAEYAGDNGDPDLEGCDQLAVILEDEDAVFFGGVAGADEYETVIRSVGRVDIDELTPVSIALVLLEQEDCLALNFSGGGSSGEILVKGTERRPGIIQADSDGTGDDCNPVSQVIEGENKNGVPLVRALSAPVDADIHGIGSTYAQFRGGTNGISWTSSRSDNATEVWMCDRDDGTAVATCDSGPVGNDRVTREPADDRYLDDLTDLRTEANAVFGPIVSNAVPAGFTPYSSISGDCSITTGETITVTAADLAAGDSGLYVDCAMSISGSGSLTVESGIPYVAFQSTIAITGGVLDLRDPRQVFIRGTNSGDAVTSSGAFLVNADGAASCEARHTADQDATTELVVRDGELDLGGGGTTKLCSTVVHLMGGETSASPVNTSGTYPAPYNNTANSGTFRVGGGGSADWTAPNTETTGLPSAGSYRFEDLAVWTESSNDSLLSGGGAMELSGIFFLGNAGPANNPGGLVIGGTPGGVINFDAQVWTRKLDHNGNARLIMRANPEDSIPVPFFGGFYLVR